MKICTLASSSSGNCTVVSHNGAHILIDAGISLRRVKEGLRQIGLPIERLEAVLITHEHSDHISGIGMLIKHYKTPVFCSRGAGSGICRTYPEAGPFVNCFEPGSTFTLNSIKVTSFRTPHDTQESVGYTIEADGKKLIYVTDLGYVTREVIDAATGADIAIIEANHDREMLRNGPYPSFMKKRIMSKYGHLSNDDSAQLSSHLAASGLRRILLAHLSRENNTPECAVDTVGDVLCGDGFVLGDDIELDVAPPFTMSRLYDL